MHDLKFCFQVPCNEKHNSFSCEACSNYETRKNKSKKCKKPLPCGHPCPRYANEACASYCPKLVKLSSNCSKGHEVSVPCSKKSSSIKILHLHLPKLIKSIFQQLLQQILIAIVELLAEKNLNVDISARVHVEVASMTYSTSLV